MKNGAGENEKRSWRKQKTELKKIKNRARENEKTIYCCAGF
jgi:hypothetical protein